MLECDPTHGGSRLPAPEPTGPLLPFEQREVAQLLALWRNTPERVKTAFLTEVVPPALRYGVPEVRRTKPRIRVPARHV